MKRILVTILSITMFTASHAQDTGSPLLSTALKQYGECNQQANVSCILDFMWPEVFEIAGREEMQEQLAKDLDSELMGLDSFNCLPAIVQKVVDGKTYKLVPYTMLITMSVKALGDGVKPEDIVEQMIAQYGKGRVRLTEDKAFIKLRPSELYLVARQVNNKANWQLIAYSQARMVMPHLLPEDFKVEADKIVDPEGKLFYPAVEDEPAAELFVGPDTVLYQQEVAPARVQEEQPKPPVAPKKTSTKPAAVKPRK